MLKYELGEFIFISWDSTDEKYAAPSWFSITRTNPVMHLSLFGLMCVTDLGRERGQGEGGQDWQFNLMQISLWAALRSVPDWTQRRRLHVGDLIILLRGEGTASVVAWPAANGLHQFSLHFRLFSNHFLPQPGGWVGPSVHQDFCSAEWKQRLGQEMRSKLASLPASPFL